jgi:hypothetical protein
MEKVEVSYRRPEGRTNLEVESYGLIFKFTKIYFPQYHLKARYSADDLAGEIYMDFYRVRRTGKTLMETLREDLTVGEKENYIKRIVLTKIIDAINRDAKLNNISIDEYSSNEGDSWTDRGDVENTLVMPEELITSDIFDEVEEQAISKEALINTLMSKQATSLAKVRNLYTELTKAEALSKESKTLFEEAFKTLKETRGIRATALSEDETIVEITAENKSYKVVYGSRNYVMVQALAKAKGLTKTMIKELFTTNGFKSSAVDVYLKNHRDMFSYNKETKLISLV